MSEQFDPRKVERVEADANFNGEGWYQCTIVQAADYDALLRIYEDALIVLQSDRETALNAIKARNVAEQRDSLNLKAFASYIRDRYHHVVMSDLEVSEVIREWTAMEEEGVGPQDIAETVPPRPGMEGVR